MKTLFILMFLTPSIIFGQFQGKNFIDQNYIEVTGKSEMLVVPDKIYLTIVLRESDSKNKITIVELEQKMRSKLKELNIDLTKNLSVKDINSNFKSAFLAKDAILLSKEYQLLVNNGKTAGQVFVALKKAGISNVSIEKLDHSKIIEYRKEVKVNAIKAAKEKAILLANAVDQNIGKALFIQEGRYTATNYNIASNSAVLRRRNYATSNLELDNEVDFEKIKLEYEILCRFELK